MSNPIATRDYSINTLRAFAIFIVVLYHAVLADAERAGRFYFEFEILIRYIPREIFTAVVIFRDSVPELPPVANYPNVIPVSSTSTR